MGNLGGFCMVFVDLCENEIADMVESFYRNGDGSSRILTNRAVGEIVEHYCSFEADGRITTNLRDFLLYSVVLNQDGRKVSLGKDNTWRDFEDADETIIDKPTHWCEIPYLKK